MLRTSNFCLMYHALHRHAQKKLCVHKILGPIPIMTFDAKVISVAQNLRSIKNTIDNHCAKYEHPQSNCKMFSLNIFYFNLVRYKYIQVTECKRIRTNAGSLCYSSPSVRYLTDIQCTGWMGLMTGRLTFKKKKKECRYAFNIYFLIIRENQRFLKILVYHGMKL